MTGNLTCGIDIGGTKIAGAVVDEDGTVLAEGRVNSPATDASAIESAVAGLVAQLVARHPVTAVGVGAAGYIHSDRSTVLFAPNIAWRNEPLGADLSRLIGLPVVVENDGNVAAWGEFRYGAGRDHDDQLMVTVGTGVGGGVIAGGRLLRGAHGVAGEIGHLRLVPDGRLCGCGNHGCLEQYGSGSALVRDTRQAVVADPAAARGLLERAGGDVEAIDGPLVTAAAKDGDAFARARLADLGDALGQGIASLAAVLDPGVVVIGGGVSEARDLLLDPIRAAFERELTGRGYRPEAEIRLAAMGNRAGVVGAADLARG
ncbi:ROK family glucokinase [Nocardioides daeguensis]|uniref:glucokinase n=1 Tax=Nocardioides daeguensis TaxID=908359 RepID=A0ABP6UWK9_9ACTN|nr:ROK family glucokinase [Nocardioides daeguensis]MBV6725740.1 ROK family glucokinase [Nocardioides daeguensis]MCR1772745.1 ROK family glucokinase [Nocardioides daeguensis]